MQKEEALAQRLQLEKYLKWVDEEGGSENPTRLDTILSHKQMMRLSWLKRHCVGRIMELGTCYGFVLAYCNGHIGVDWNRRSIQLAHILNPTKEFHIADIRKLPFKDKCVDTVIMPDILEHLNWEDVPRALGEAFRVAGKRVLITIPNDGSQYADSFKHQWLCTPSKRKQILDWIKYDVKTLIAYGFVLIEVNLKTRTVQNRQQIETVPKVGFFATRENYVDHLLPIYNAFPKDKRGAFMVSQRLLLQYARSKGIDAVIVNSRIKKHNWVVMAGLGMIQSFRSQNLILLNHGCGGFWNVNHQSYAGGNGARKFYRMILEPGDIPGDRDKKIYPQMRVEVIGCPKMDRWYPVIPKERSQPPVIAIGFHQDTKVCPEAQSALAHYLSALPELAKWQESGDVKIIGTGHPIYWKILLPLWQKYHFEPILDFDEVIKKADVYVRDQYSTIYEFASLDRPVVLLNAPWYRRDVEHGMRFWELSTVGINCNKPEDLIPCIKLALEDKPEQRELRRLAVNRVYKYMDGKSTERAIKAILSMDK
jgi:ubiquinone/menaquinone biosynthesis C-methylase UbiE